MTQRGIGTALIILLGMAFATRAEAQGLLWQLPADGSEVVYGGTMTQVNTRPDGQESTMTWERQLAIRSVGQEQATVDDEQVPARWIEFELRTGQASEQGIDTGLVGLRIFRVLVPAAAITGKPADDRDIPNAFLPILQGFQQIGDQPAQPLEAKAFAIAPLLTQLRNYRGDQLKAEGEEPVDVPAGQFTATKYAASETQENRSTSVENSATMFVSKEVPFGLARWQVTTTQSVKDPNQPRDAFEARTRIEATMEARAINQNAQATLQAP